MAKNTHRDSAKFEVLNSTPSFIEVRDLIPYGDMWLPGCVGDVGWDTGGEFFRCRTIYPPEKMREILGKTYLKYT